MGKEKGAAKEKSTVGSKILTGLGIALCVILVPVLIINVTLLIKSYTKPDEYPTFAGYTMMIVKSPSMDPTIKVGDMILVKKADAEDIKGDSSADENDGDIISFFDPDSSRGSVLTHRCIEVVPDENGEISFVTKGDANNSLDPTNCPASELIGIYVTRIPGAGNVAFWLQTIPGLITCIAVPIVLLVAYDLIMKKRYDKSKKKDTDALLAELEALRAQQAAAENANAPAEKAAETAEKATEAAAPPAEKAEEAAEKATEAADAVKDDTSEEQKT